MKCKKCQDLIFTYQDGQLVEAEKNEFERHLRACPPCSAQLEEIRQIGGRLHTSAAGAVPGADFDKPWRKIAAAISPAPRRHFSFFAGAALGTAGSGIPGLFSFWASPPPACTFPPPA